MPKTKEIEDGRFSQIKWHPKFRRVPRQIRKVKIDKRFESMFKDPNFKLKQVVDKRGRPLARTSNEDLRRYYDLSSSGESEDEKLHSKSKKFEEDEHSGSADIEEHSEESEESSDDDQPEKEEEEEIRLDLARGEGNISSSSDDSSSEWEFEEEDGPPVHEWTDVDVSQAPATEKATNRLAICNMDWKRITARDLLILLNSFKPTSGDVRSIKIYLSEFGKQRLAEEEKCGPVELRETKVDDEEIDDEGQSFVNNDQEERQQRILLEKLRQYEFNRLKYYYAVAECDSAQTAEFIYSSCDGTEYETSGTKLDLRFIPDDMEFDERPTDGATSFGDLVNYRPNVFVNKALQQSRPELTWEEEWDLKRKELTKKAFENPEEWDRLELDGVLASPSDSEQSDNNEEWSADAKFNASENSNDVIEQPKKKTLKTMLMDSTKKESGDEDDDVEMEIKWDTGMEEKLEKSETSTSKGTKMSQWEKYLERRKQKRHQRKEETRQKRLIVKRQRYGSGSEEDAPFGREEDSRTVSKIKRRKAHPESANEANAEEKKKRQAELTLLLEESDEEIKRRHFNLKQLLKGDKKSKKYATSDDANEEEDFAMNYEDPRFQAMYTSHLYNIDPSDPAFKKTPGMKRLIEDKISLKREHEKAKKPPSDRTADQPLSTSVDAPATGEQWDMNLTLLAKKLKAKTDSLKAAKDKRKKSMLKS